MFGYIMPRKCELKIREYDYYRSAYCGLCNSLKQKCGLRARFILNYDFVFAALLLSYARDEETGCVKKRCVAHAKKRACIISDSYDKAAGISVILTYFKLCDDIADSPFLKRIKSRLFCVLLKRAFLRASEENSKFYRDAERLYKELDSLEGKRVASIDEPADKFAGILASIASGEEKQRVLREVFYHIGRFIYIIDALDDVEEDFKKSEYNPIIERFKLTNGELTEEVENEVVLTLNHSVNAVLAAFELLDRGEGEGVIRNIIELGMRDSIERVLKKEKQK